jgi:hypothetical protein
MPFCASVNRLAILRRDVARRLEQADFFLQGGHLAAQLGELRLDAGFQRAVRPNCGRIGCFQAGSG